MSKLSIKYVWEVPVRVTHWVNVLAMTTLCITGIFIGHPLSIGESASAYTMGWIRFVHFTAAYVFALGLAIRVYWSLVGNKYSSWRAFFPFLNKTDRDKMLATFKYYLFLDRKLPHMVGHNAVASIAYFLAFLLYLGMIVSGFTLYSEHAPGGMMHRLLGWITKIFSNQSLRLIHHSFMWLLIGFIINHIYSCWLMDIKERGGVISSMFSGYKSTEEE